MVTEPARPHPDGLPVPDPLWLDRMHSLGAAQARYLWLLLVACLFYLALQLQPIPTATVTVPIVELQLSRNAVAAAGPAVISFLVLAMMGALAGQRRAYLQTVASARPPTNELDGERLDTHPNAIDLAFYTDRQQTPRLFRTLAHFKYPAALTLALAEVVWLAWSVSHTWPWIVIASALVFGAAAVRVARMWKGRVATTRDVWNGMPTPPRP
jgi:hypothetical protein